MLSENVNHIAIFDVDGRAFQQVLDLDTDTAHILFKNKSVFEADASAYISVNGEHKGGINYVRTGEVSDEYHYSRDGVIVFARRYNFRDFDAYFKIERDIFAHLLRNNEITLEE